MQDLVASTLNALQAAAIPERAAFAAGYHPSAERILGVPAPALHGLAAELKPRLRAASPDEILALAAALAGTGVLEARVVGMLIVAAHRPTLVALDRSRLEALGRGMDNWVAVDTFGTLLAGDALRRGGLHPADLLAWAASPDRWWRRAALVATTGWNKKSHGGRGNTADTLAVCTALLADRDPMVVKALSWALRELIPWDPEAVRTFLELQGDKVAAQARREVQTKLRTGTKSGRSARPS